MIGAQPGAGTDQLRDDIDLIVARSLGDGRIKREPTCFARLQRIGEKYGDVVADRRVRAGDAAPAGTQPDAARIGGFDANPAAVVDLRQQGNGGSGQAGRIGRLDGDAALRKIEQLVFDRIGFDEDSSPRRRKLAPPDERKRGREHERALQAMLADAGRDLDRYVECPRGSGRHAARQRDVLDLAIKIHPQRNTGGAPNPGESRIIADRDRQCRACAGCVAVT